MSTGPERSIHAVTAADLRNLELWERLGADHLERLAGIARRQEVDAGVELFREGTPADQVYFVIWGRVTLAIAVPGRGSLDVGTVAPGELLGWSGLLGEHAWATTARAVKPSSLLVFPGASLTEMCELDHEVGYYVMRSAFASVSRRLHETRLQLVAAPPGA
jgi:CRP/FNR family transcriptional regulator, cyclic AMP receptor protein